MNPWKCSVVPLPYLLPVFEKAVVQQLKTFSLLNSELNLTTSYFTLHNTFRHSACNVSIFSLSQANFSSDLWLGGTSLLNSEFTCFLKCFGFLQVTNNQLRFT